MLSRLFAAAGAAAVLSLAAAAQADAAVIATLTFDTPSAVVANNVDIPVWVTLTLDPSSDALKTDASGDVTSPDTTDLFTQYPDATRIILNNSFGCSGTFNTACNSPTDDYNFQFNFSSPSFVGPTNLDLEPGTSTSFLFGTFTLVNGASHGGTYTYYNTTFEYEIVNGGAPIGFQTIADTCPGQTADCAFTRTVQEVVPPGTGGQGNAVPEPAAWALMIVGFAGAGAQLRLRRRLRAA